MEVPFEDRHFFLLELRCRGWHFQKTLALRVRSLVACVHFVCTAYASYFNYVYQCVGDDDDGKSNSDLFLFSCCSFFSTCETDTTMSWLCSVMLRNFGSFSIIDVPNLIYQNSPVQQLHFCVETEKSTLLLIAYSPDVIITIYHYAQ